ncbi:MAG TPA: LamG domain-containing protein [Verrucomicrobiae bacterium]
MKKIKFHLKLALALAFSSLAASAIAQTNECTPPPSCIIGWWAGENNTVDTIGGNNGIWLNGSSYASGEVNTAFNFGGPTPQQSVDIPYSPTLISTNFSVEAWIKPTGAVDSPIGQTLIFGQSYGHVQLVVRSGSSTNTVVPVFQFGTSFGSFPDVVATNEIPVGSFTHLAGTWDGTTLKLYVNGVLNNTSVPGATPTDSTCDFNIGGIYHTNADSCNYVGQFFTGVIDEVSYYHCALSAEEINAIYSAGSYGKCQPIPCVTPAFCIIGWWAGEFNALDSIGGNNGTWLNGSSYTSGEVNAAFNFGGPTPQQSVDIPYSPTLITTNFSVETWIKPSGPVDSSIGQTFIFGQSYGHVQLVVRTGSTTNTVIPVFQFGTSSGSFPDVVATTEIPVGSFTHLAGTWNGTFLKIYINGVLNNTSVPGAIPTDSGCDFDIGGIYHPAIDSCNYVGQFFSGAIDEVSYYSCVLSDDDINAIYNAGSSGKCH